MAFIGPGQVPDWSKMSHAYGPTGSATTAYIGHARKDDQVEQFAPIGVLISYTLQKLAWEDPALRGLADYYRVANIAGSGSGGMRMWPSTIYGDEIRARVEAGRLANGRSWDEWSIAFQ